MVNKPKNLLPVIFAALTFYIIFNFLTFLCGDDTTHAKKLELHSDKVHISIVAACMDRNELLESTMESWMSALDNSKQRGELVLVDWSSKIPHQETLERLKLDKDPRIRLVRVENEPFWILTIAYNHAAASISKSSTHIVKLDCDTFISSHFFQNISFTSDRYHAINVTGAKNENAVNLHGVSIIPSRAFQAVQGFDERIQSYGYEDEDLYQRLNRNGLIRTELDYSHMMHLSHAKTGSTSQNITRYDLEVETRVNQLLGQKLPRWSKEDTPSSFSVSKMSDRIFSARMVTRSQRNTKLFTEEQINQTIQEALKDRLIDLGVPSNILESPSSSTEYEKFWNSYKDGPMITIHVAKGLGHRIQSLVSGMAIARKTGRHLRVVWPVDGDFQARFEDLFDADGFDVWTRLDPREHKSPKLDVYNYLDSKNKASIDHVTPHHIYASSASFLKGPLLSRYELGYSLIKLKPALELQKELNSTAELSECYGVHLSKNVNEAVLEEFESKIWSLIEEDKSSCFYASSEISAHKDRLRKTFGDQMVFSRQSCSDATLKCVQETLVDLFVLLNTSWFLGSPLTPYSQLAALVIGEIWYPGQGK